MSKPQTWSVVATSAQRFYLARMLLSDAIKVRNRKEDTKLWRARVALGLIGITEAILRGPIATKLINAPVSHVFPVTVENAEYLLECRDKCELGTGESNVLRPLLEQLDDPTATLEHSHDLPPFDEAAELPLWEPPKKTDPPPPDAT